METNLVDVLCHFIDFFGPRHFFFRFLGSVRTALKFYLLLLLELTGLQLTADLEGNTAPPSQLEEKPPLSAIFSRVPGFKFLLVLLSALEPITGLVDQQEIN